ncbi:MAG TPA: ANTAR domain-containing protein [Actinomycetes bacterium]|jgi:AmiR/NasT family two-component response regulator
MERRKLDEKAAFELLRRHARSTRMPLDEVARQVIAGGRLTR